MTGDVAPRETPRQTDSSPQNDLVRGWRGVGIFCLPTVALLASAPMGDRRWWIWSPALALMGVACLVNAAQCGRRHCYFTGPALLIAALGSVLEGTHVLSVGWDWIVYIILVGCAAGCLLEWSTGTYAKGGR